MALDDAMQSLRWNAKRAEDEKGMERWGGRLNSLVVALLSLQECEDGGLGCVLQSTDSLVVGSRREKIQPRNWLGGIIQWLVVCVTVWLQLALPFPFSSWAWLVMQWPAK